MCSWLSIYFSTLSSSSTSSFVIVAIKQMDFAYKFNAVSSYQTLLNCNNRGNFWEKPKIRLAQRALKPKPSSAYTKFIAFSVHTLSKQSTKLESSAVVAVRNDLNFRRNGLLLDNLKVFY